MGDTKIEWTQKSWNPARGCSRVSEGCRHCYAERVAARFSGPGAPYEGLAEIGPAGPRWTGEVRFIPEKLAEPLHWKKPQMVFVNSMSDLFHDGLAFEQIAAIFGVMAAARRHTFQVLTKRPERALAFFRWLGAGDFTVEAVGRIAEAAAHREGLSVNIADLSDGRQWPLTNVWLGVSIEDQKTAEQRIPLLLRCPAVVHWISYEPALGPVDLSRWLPGLLSDGGCSRCGFLDSQRGHPERCPQSVNWVVCGGESGRGARPMHPNWARSVCDQCQTAGVPYFFKQWGEWSPYPEHFDLRRETVVLKNHNDTTWSYTGPNLYRVGKGTAGRRLDGREWNEMPERTG